MTKGNQSITIRLSLKNILSILIMALALYICYKSRQILLTCVISILLAYIANPLIEKLVRLKVPRIVGTVIIIGFIIAIIAATGLWLGPTLYKDITAFTNNLPGYIDQIMESLNNFGKKIGIDLSGATVTTHITAWAKKYAAKLIEWSGGVIGTLKYAVTLALNIVLIPVIAFTMLFDYQKVNKFVDKYAGINTPARRTLNLFGDVMAMYFRGQLVVAFILAILYSIVLKIAGLESGIFLGIMTGMLSIIPYMGFAIGSIVSIIMAAIQFQDMLHPIYVIIGYAFVQFLESFFISPSIVGNSVGLHPVVTMVVLLIGGAVFGFVGMIFAIPVTAMLFKIYQHQFAVKINPDFDNQPPKPVKKRNFKFPKIIKNED